MFHSPAFSSFVYFFYLTFWFAIVYLTNSFLFYLIFILFFFFFFTPRFRLSEIDRLTAEENNKNLNQQISEKETRASAAEGDLKIEREWRVSLQETMVKDREKICQLNQELSSLKATATVSAILNF